ncbi:hypothetical protein D5278_00525 [bacterium 1XD21-13]|nr:hypothetical protein [bacterium 1XD21-13]
MKRNVWNQIKLLALAGVISLTLLGCGGTDDAEDKAPVQEEQQEPLSTGDKEGEPDASQDNTDAGKQVDNTGSQDEEEPVGEITELGDGQFTMKKFYQETGEDGSMIMASPAEGADGEEEMEKLETLKVLCDENTRVYKRTIRDGGASYEDSESSFEKLEKGMQVNLKGSHEGDAYRATEVQIVEVVL